MNHAWTAVTLDEWNNVLAINATGVMLSYKYAGIQMIKQGRGGRIIGKFVRTSFRVLTERYLKVHAPSQEDKVRVVNGSLS